MMSNSNAFAQESDDFVNSLKEPANFEVMILLNNVISVDRLNGNYELDFWYSIASDDFDFTQIPPPDVDFTNGIIDDISSEYVEAHYMEKRVRGTFFNIFDFRDFPFDKTNLKVVVEPVRPWTSDKATLHVSVESGIDKEANIPGYTIDEGFFLIDTHQYEGETKTYDRYVANFSVERSWLGSFLKIMFPTLIVLGISFVAFMLPEHFDAAIALALLPLASVVFLQVATLDEIPPLGYLTIYDKMMVIVYALITNIVIAIGREAKVALLQDESTATETIWKLNSFHLKISPIIAVSLGIALYFI